LGYLHGVRLFFLGTLIFFFTILGFTCVIAAESSRAISVEADEIQILKESHSVVASGNLHIVFSGVAITGKNGVYEPSIKRLTLRGNIGMSYQKLHMQADTVVADGRTQTIVGTSNVTFTFENASGKAEKIVYNLKNQQVSITGDPDFTRGANRLSSPEILIYVKENRVQTKGKTRLIISEKGL